MPTISESKKGKIHHICMVKPATGRKVDCYFTTGHVKRFEMAYLLKPDGLRPCFPPIAQSQDIPFDDDGYEGNVGV